MAKKLKPSQIKPAHYRLVWRESGAVFRADSVMCYEEDSRMEYRLKPGRKNGELGWLEASDGELQTCKRPRWWPDLETAKTVLQAEEKTSVICSAEEGQLVLT